MCASIFNKKSHLEALCSPSFYVQRCFLRSQQKPRCIYIICPCDVGILSSHQQTSGLHRFIYLTCQRRRMWGKEKGRKWITGQNGESHLLLLTENSQTRDKEIPFVRNDHSALFQRNPLTEWVSLWVSREIMPLWWWWAKICVTGYCHYVNLVIYVRKRMSDLILCYTKLLQ